MSRTSPWARLVAVGLGPAGEGGLTLAALQALASASIVVLRTEVHPGVGELLRRKELAGKAVYACDPLYENASNFEEVYTSIAERLASLAGRGPLEREVALAGLNLVSGSLVASAESETLVYAVPGSPLVAERSVELLSEAMGGELEVVPGLSFLDLAIARAGVDPYSSSLRLLDAQELLAAPERYEGDLLLAQVWNAQIASELMAILSPPESSREVLVLSHLGLEEEVVTPLRAASLASVRFDHLTSLYVRGYGGSAVDSFLELASVVARLRLECPWDRKQTHASLGKHLIEESYEVLDAIEALGDARTETEEGAYSTDTQYLADEFAAELGDLLVQVFFHAVIAQEEGFFDLGFVMETIRAKLIRRHPHVFAGLEVAGVEQVLSNWEEIKRSEKETSEPAETVPSSMPALLYAAKVIRKAGAFGYSPPDAEGAKARVARLARDVSEGGLGELAFAIAELGKLLGVDLEAELRAETKEFSRRFRED